jgi:chromate reductase
MICIISGTNRKNSNSIIVARHYQALLNRNNTPNTIVDLADLPADFIVSALYENTGKNEEFNRLQEIINQADKIVFIVPEYNGSLPGILKTFIDGLDYPGGLRDKKAALVGLSSGMQGGVLAVSHLTDILNYLGTTVLALKPKLALIEKNLQDDKITNPLYLELLETQAQQMVEF